MAKPTNTVIAANEIGMREDLENVVYRVAVEETPFTANIGTGPRAKNTQHEWELDSLAAVNLSNAQAEGDDVTADAVTQPTRVANIMQIMRKAVSVSGTSEATDEVQNYSSQATQLVKKGLELRRDAEAIMLNRQSAATSDPRAMGGLPAWIATNAQGGTSFVAPTLSSKLPVIGTDGTQRNISEALVKAVLQACFISRGRTPKVLMVGPVNKGKFSAFSGIAASRFNIQKDAPATIIGAADVYVGDFGNLTVMPNIFQRERDAWFLDFEMIERVNFRPLQKQDLAKTGDSDRAFIIQESTLKVNNEAAHGWLADLNTT